MEPKRAEPCGYCGEFHVGDYGGSVYCQGPHHIAHGPTGILSEREKEIAKQFGGEKDDQ